MEALTQLPPLAALRVTNGALRGDKLPSRIKILNWGENPSVKGTFKVGPKTLASLAANQRALGFERIAIDYNHTSAPGAPDYVGKGQVPPIFGYGKPVAIENDGLYLEDITWTPLGAQHARNFEDLSPALHPSTPDTEVEFIHSVALTTNGALHDVTFFSVHNNKKNDQPDPSNPSETQIMSTQSTPAVLTLAVLAASIGLAETATQDQVTAKLRRLSELEALTPLIKDGKVIVLEELATLRADIAAIKSASDERDRATVLASLGADGKVPRNADGKPYSAEDLAKLDITTLRILAANTPSTVPLSARGKRPADTTDPNLKGAARTAAAWSHLEK